MYQKKIEADTMLKLVSKINKSIFLQYYNFIFQHCPDLVLPSFFVFFSNHIFVLSTKKVPGLLWIQLSIKYLTLVLDVKLSTSL